MTLEQVMALDGRELDLLVAERITDKVRRHESGSIRISFNSALAVCVFPDGVRDKCRVNEDGSPNWEKGDGDRWFTNAIPHFSRDWSAAMQIRDWARGLGGKQMYVWAMAVTECLDARLANTQSRSQYLDVLLWAIPADYARAALLVSVEG